MVWRPNGVQHVSNGSESSSIGEHRRRKKKGLQAALGAWHFQAEPLALILNSGCYGHPLIWQGL